MWLTCRCPVPALLPSTTILSARGEQTATERKAPVYREAKEMCAAIGVDGSELSHFIRDLQLPVFKIDGPTRWLALKKDLGKWLWEQRDPLYVPIAERKN